ncbi:hypothetical protein CUV01_05400 [Paracoccus tegillarcae]|uniref:Uncharacterized protein n=1 Tax=Paracoccus tegillarcae TaxID=1529068 RepID=A0A2K9F188_9RHOB|nr:hypothetical protein CUV01_05400 [Paracoccus tegillarcae]
MAGAVVAIRRQADIAPQMWTEAFRRSISSAPLGFARASDHRPDQRDDNDPRTMPVDQLLQRQVGRTAPQGKSGNHFRHLRTRMNAGYVE